MVIILGVGDRDGNPLTTTVPVVYRFARFSVSVITSHPEYGTLSHSQELLQQLLTWTGRVKTERIPKHIRCQPEVFFSAFVSLREKAVARLTGSGKSGPDTSLTASEPVQPVGDDRHASVSEAAGPTVAGQDTVAPAEDYIDDDDSEKPSPRVSGRLGRMASLLEQARKAAAARSKESVEENKKLLQKAEEFRNKIQKESEDKKTKAKASKSTAAVAGRDRNKQTQAASKSTAAVAGRGRGQAASKSTTAVAGQGRGRGKKVAVDRAVVSGPPPTPAVVSGHADARGASSAGVAERRQYRTPSPTRTALAREPRTPTRRRGESSTDLFSDSFD